jgi:hypothetical protein
MLRQLYTTQVMQWTAPEQRARLTASSLAQHPCGHLSRVLCGKLPGGSGNAALILAQLGGQGVSNFPHASRVGCSERLCENPKIANRVPTGGQDRAPAMYSGPTSA